MATGIKLHALVKSLSANEKRHFKLKCSIQKGPRNYMLLFEVLEDLEAYDRTRVLKHLQHQIFSKDLHVTENYLYQRILESLRSYHERNSLEAKLYNQLLNANLLQDRGLYELSENMLKKARKTAESSLNGVFVIEVLKRQLRNIMAQQVRQMEAQTQTACLDLERQASALLEEIELYSLKQQTFVKYRIGRQVKTPEDQAWVQAILEKSIIQKKVQFPAFYSEYLQHTVRNNCYVLLGDFEKAVVEMEQSVALWEANPTIRKQQNSLYMVQLANLINHKNRIGQQEEVPALIDKLAAVKTTSFDEAAEQFQNVYFHRLCYWLQQQQFVQALSLVPAIEQGLKDYAPKITRARTLSFYYNITIAFFLTEDYENAMHWLAKIQDIQRSNEQRRDIQRFARILHLAMSYHMQTNESVEDLLRRIYRKKEYEQELHAFERLVLQKFKQALKLVPSTRVEQKFFQGFAQALEELSEQQKNVLGFEEFLLWIKLVYLKQIA